MRRLRPRKRAWTAQALPASTYLSTTQITALSPVHQSTKYSSLWGPG